MTRQSTAAPQSTRAAADDHPFILWNLRLLDAFFSPASRGDESWLQVDPAELDALGPDLGGDEGFLSAVALGAPWLRSAPEADAGRLFVERARLLADQRRLAAPRPPDYVEPGKLSAVYAGRNAPNYLPYLAALVRSASIAQEGFYRHLSDALGFEEGWGSLQMARLDPVWHDLERWTTSNDGDFGYFRFRTLGGYRLIGVPRSQSIVTARDTSLIARVFAQAGLRPGQHMGPGQLRSIRELAAHSAFLSTGLRQALGEPDYEEATNSRLESLFSDWDGSVPAPAQSGHAADQSGAPASEDESLTLSLSLRDADEIEWVIHWRAPALRDAGTLVLRHGDHAWVAPLAGTEGAGTVTDDEAGLQQAAARLLDQSAIEDVAFDACVRDASGIEADAGQLVLRQQLLRVLTWDYDPVDNRDELRERPLPLHGAAYLVAPPQNAERLVEYLGREAIPHEQIPAAGLPPGWLVACVPDSSGVDDAKRETLPDGQKERPAPKVLRFVGGRSVSRAGTRQYLAYDLPAVELDAPEGAEIQANGLVLYEAPRPEASLSRIRRFTIVSMEDGVLAFDLRVVRDGRLLEEPTRLRVAPGGGTSVGSGRDFALDRFGGRASAGTGLSGVLPTAVVQTPLPTVDGFSVANYTLGQRAGAAEVERAASSPAALLLDSLAREGALAFGIARDQLARFLVREDATTGPVEVLLDLRRRGHLELETDHKGHLIRVHAVAPTLYPLPLSTGGLPVLGVLGTLRLEHWRWLARADEVSVLASGGDRGELDAWSLVLSQGALAEFAQAGGFAWSEAPQLAIATWAPDHHEVYERIAAWGMQDLGNAGLTAQKLSPATCRYIPTRDGVALDDGIGCQLFCMEDLETKRHRVYALGIRQPGSPPRYAFVRDSRWGTWLALCAFGRYVRGLCGFPDASPWPLPYIESSGTLWVLARAGMPAVLERALTLCSGAGPVVVDVTPDHGPDGIVLRHGRAALEAPVVGMVYDQMAAGRWLAYRWVPREVAEVVATKLGAVLAPA